MMINSGDETFFFNSQRLNRLSHLEPVNSLTARRNLSLSYFLPPISGSYPFSPLLPHSAPLLPYTSQSANACLHLPSIADHFHHIKAEPKPNQSYIGLIAMAILSSSEKKLVLSDIYHWITTNHVYFQSKGTGWKNSIRHNLSLNDCFVKSGRCSNGKGHYWSIHPANFDDFSKGDFRRRRAQQKVKRYVQKNNLDLSTRDYDSSDDDQMSPMSACSSQEFSEENKMKNAFENGSSDLKKKRKPFDIESLLDMDELPEKKSQ